MRGYIVDVIQSFMRGYIVDVIWKDLSYYPQTLCFSSSSGIYVALFEPIEPQNVLINKGTVF